MILITKKAIRLPCGKTPQLKHLMYAMRLAAFLGAELGSTIRLSRATLRTFPCRTVTLVGKDWRLRAGVPQVIEFSLVKPPTPLLRRKTKTL